MPSRPNANRDPAIVPPSRGKARPVAKRDEIASFDRRQQIIAEAARLFASKGFDGTSVRDIAGATGILAGSLYYHFASKEELFVAVHAAGMDLLIRSVNAAIAAITDPWDRLAAAAAAHCAAVLEAGHLMALVVPNFPVSIEQYRGELVRQRDDYERVVADLVAALDLPASLNRTVFRLHFLGALNWAQTWYQPGHGMTPEEIGRQLVATLRFAGGGAAR